MPPRRVRRNFQEVERNLLHNMYRQNGALWDVILNDMRRDERFPQLPENVRQLYEMAGNGMQRVDAFEISLRENSKSKSTFCEFTKKV